MLRSELLGKVVGRVGQQNIYQIVFKCNTTLFTKIQVPFFKVWAA